MGEKSFQTFFDVSLKNEFCPKLQHDPRHCHCYKTKSLLTTLESAYTYSSILISLFRMRISTLINITLSVVGVLLMIFAENSDAGSFYPKFKKTRPSLTRFKTGLSRVHPSTSYGSPNTQNQIRRNGVYSRIVSYRPNNYFI